MHIFTSCPNCNSKNLKINNKIDDHIINNIIYSIYNYTCLDCNYNFIDKGESSLKTHCNGENEL